MSDQDRKISLTLQRASGQSDQDVVIENLVVAGWTGRDAATVQKHIAELEALGVRRPASTPIFYRVAAARLTTRDLIEASGAKSSGEVEFALLQSGGHLWVGSGSDHTDREVEAYGVTVSKQMCDKPIGQVFWLYEETAPHWGQLVLRSFIRENGKEILYQEGPVTAMMDPADLIAGFTGGGGKLPESTLMLCGTLSVKGGVRSSDYFRFEIDDPVLGRKIQHGYHVVSLPILG